MKPIVKAGSFLLVLCLASATLAGRRGRKQQGKKVPVAVFDAVRVVKGPLSTSAVIPPIDRLAHKMSACLHQSGAESDKRVRIALELAVKGTGIVQSVTVRLLPALTGKAQQCIEGLFEKKGFSSWRTKGRQPSLINAVLKVLPSRATLGVLGLLKSGSGSNQAQVFGSGPGDGHNTGHNTATTPVTTPLQHRYNTVFTQSHSTLKSWSTGVVFLS